MKYDVIGFAREELKKYLEIIGVDADISLLLFDDAGIQDTAIKDKKYDDAIEISVKEERGYIAGSNERSVLIGVYRLLNEWGIKWIRPGENGTYIPKECSPVDIELHEAASRRHRTVCIEGAVSIENVLDMIDWLPKMGFNGYYIQFNDAFIFFDRWYSHRGHPTRAGELFTDGKPFSYEKALEYVKIMIKEIKRRGLILQRMGHGWTCDPFGITNHGWDSVDPATIPDSYREICALVNGKRDVWLNKPLATQLCYSSPYVKEKMVGGVIKYIEENPETDIIHFWLGDYYNNTCECPNCTKPEYSYADYYLAMVNELTKEMKQRGIDKKIVFTIGYNKAYPPKVERIIHTENTILMFAPISRTFAQSYPTEFKLKNAPEYTLNAFDLPRSVDENLAYLYEWEKCYDGDTVDFDYHLMWDHVLDAGGEGIAKVLHQDIKNFSGLGINGLISCQLQRNTFPTSIAMTTMARTLWKTDTDFDTVRRELYSASFGEGNADLLCEYFSTLSRGFDIGAIRSQVEVDADKFKKNIQTALSAMDDIGEVIEKNKNVDDPCHRTSWELLSAHREIYSILARGIIAQLGGDTEALEKHRLESVARAWELEEITQHAFDTMFYQSGTRYRINLNKAIAFFDF